LFISRSLAIKVQLVYPTPPRQIEDFLSLFIQIRHHPGTVIILNTEECSGPCHPSSGRRGELTKFTFYLTTPESSIKMRHHPGTVLAFMMEESSGRATPPQ
jgi:hypothetical protein